MPDVFHSHLPDTESETRARKIFRIALGTVFVLALPVLFYFLLNFETVALLSDSYGLETKRPAPEFTLLDATGKEVSPVDFRGEFYYLYFGFTTCDTACPASLGVLTRLRAGLAGRTVRFVFVSIDPVRDTRERIELYQRKYGKDFVFLRGRPDQNEYIQNLAKSYNARYDYDPNKSAKDPDYQFSHSSFIYLVTPTGKLALMYPFKNPGPTRMARDFLTLERKVGGQTRPKRENSLERKSKRKRSKKI